MGKIPRVKSTRKIKKKHPKIRVNKPAVMKRTEKSYKKMRAKLKPKIKNLKKKHPLVYDALSMNLIMDFLGDNANNLADVSDNGFKIYMERMLRPKKPESTPWLPVSGRPPNGWDAPGVHRRTPGYEGTGKYEGRSRVPYIKNNLQVLSKFPH